MGWFEIRKSDLFEEILFHPLPDVVGAGGFGNTLGFGVMPSELLLTEGGKAGREKDSFGDVGLRKYQR